MSEQLQAEAGTAAQTGRVYRARKALPAGCKAGARQDSSKGAPAGRWGEEDGVRGEHRRPWRSLCSLPGVRGHRVG